MTDNLLFHLAIGFALIERGILTLCVLIICVGLASKYRNKSTKFELSDERLLPLKVSFAIGTPLLIALLFVGYCYVDLSNPIEVSFAGAASKPSVETSGSVPALAFRGLGDSSEDQASAPAASIDAATQRQAMNDHVHLEFEQWTERSLLETFTMLANLPNPSRPSSDRVLNLSLAMGCLNSGTFQPYFNIDTFVANKSFDQVETDVHKAVSSTSFTIGLCNALKQEQQPE